MKLASIGITQQTAFCDAMLFSLAFARHWCCMITESHFVSFASGTHLKKKSIRTKLLHKHLALASFKNLLWFNLCACSLHVSDFTKQFCDTEMHITLRGPDTAVRNMREKGCFWEPRMNNSAELYAWRNMGAHSMQNLNIIQTFMTDWGCTLCIQPLSFIFFLSWSIIPPCL